MLMPPREMARRLIDTAIDDSGARQVIFGGTSDAFGLYHALIELLTGILAAHQRQNQRVDLLLVKWDGAHPGSDGEATATIRRAFAHELRAARADRQETLCER